MRYCKRCIVTDTIPRREFDEQGVCTACRYAEKTKTEIDWNKRENDLIDIVKWAKDNNNGRWDCAIGVSGGKDSTFQALYAKEELGLNCLLVNNVPDQITEVGKYNLENLVTKGFDLVSWRNNPLIMRKLVKRAFYEWANFIKPTEYPLWAVTYQTALAYSIPLIIQGENPALTLGVSKGVSTNDDAFSIFDNNTLRGGNASDWVGDDIELKDLILYQFPGKEKCKKAGIRAIYLQYYVKEWSPAHNVEFAVKHGLRGREEIPGRGNPFASVDSDLHVLNPMVKYFKFGCSNYSELLSIQIREGKITRESAIEEAIKADGYCPDKYINMFCDYINISIDEFWKVMEKVVINKKLFKKEKGKWIPRFVVGEDFDED